MRESASQRWPRHLLGVGVALVLLVVLFPYDFRNVKFLQGRMPFGFDWEAADFGRDFVLNIILFVPLGMGLAAWTEARWRPRLLGLAAALLGSSLVSGLLEWAQRFLPSRDPNLNDVLANGLGGVVGFVCLAAGKEEIARFFAALEERVLAWRITRPGILFLVYGVAALLVSVALQQTTSLRNWEDSFSLLFGNERTGDRPWSGRLTLFQLADRALSEERARELSKRTEDGIRGSDWLASYEFVGRRDELKEFSWKGGTRPGSVAAEYSGLELSGIPWLESNGPAASIARALRTTNQFTVWLRCIPAGTRQFGPARIVSISSDPYHRNFTIGQEGESLSLRLRTPLTGENGRNPEWFVPDVFHAGRMVTIVVTYDGATMRVFSDGEARPPMELGPGAVLFGVLTRINPWNLQGYHAVFSGLVFLPLGTLLGMIVCERRGTAAGGIFLLGILAPALLLEMALVVSSGKFFSGTDLVGNLVLTAAPAAYLWFSSSTLMQGA